MPAPANSYSQLVAELREIALLNSVGAVLGWDERTQLPPKGVEHRARQSSMIARMIHERLTSPRIGQWLCDAETSNLIAEPHSDAAVNVRETRRSYDRARKLPSSLVEEQTRVAVLAQQAWGEARRKSDYGSFEPWLARTLDLKRQEANCVGYAKEMYDALLDEFEPGETAANLRPMFQGLRTALIELIGKIASSPKQAPVELLHRAYDPQLQGKLARDAAERLGFDFQAGRLDVSLHPFCTGIGPGDTRMTTRFDPNYFGDAFFSVLHESGHGLYNQGLPEEHFGTPCGEAISLGIHESQSRMWENFVGRSDSFWKFFFPRFRETFGNVVADIDLDRWTFAINDVHPSLIRTEADEATYNLHILLRFELEQALLTGDLPSKDLPGAWKQKMREYLGLEPPDDAQGCLQDIHWSGGAIGYFPTYTLGNLYAAQFFEQARAELGGLDSQFAAGDFGTLLNWLREKIHRHGERFRATELIKRVTGRELSPQPLLRHLAKKAQRYGVAA